MTNQRYAGKVAVITGAGTGMGQAGALAFARQGGTVVLAGRRATELDRVAEAIREGGGTALSVPTDVGDPAQVEQLFQVTLERYGRLDFAWNNAGILCAGPVESLGVDDFDAAMRINARGSWLCMKHECELFRRLRIPGSIVTTSSWLAAGALPGSSIYSATKGALDAMTRAFAVEFGGDGIRLNNVNPGVIDTPMLRSAIPSGSRVEQPFAQHAPARRLGRAEEVAAVVLFLWSEEASFVQGQCITVDGGYTIPGHRPWLQEH